MPPRSMASIRWAFNFKTWQPTQSEWTLCCQCVQKEETDRIHRFVFKKDAKASMIGRLMIRKVIANCLKIPYKDIRLARTEKGKPYLVNDVQNPHRTFTFNVSHQGSYSVLAADFCNPVGVDVMKFESRTSTEEFFKTMRRQFTTNEWKTIKTPVEEGEQMKMFYRHWCLKESYVKALGIGIGFEVSRLNFTLPSTELREDRVITDTEVEVDGEKQKDWTFEEHLLPDHCVAVAIKHAMKQDSCDEDNILVTNSNSTPDASLFHVMDFDELISGAVPLSEADNSYWENFHPKNEMPNMPNLKPR